MSCGSNDGERSCGNGRSQYFSAIDDHQTANAYYLVDAGAGVLIGQQQLTADFLASQIKRCSRQLDVMAAAARQSASLDATASVAEQCMREAT